MQTKIQADKKTQKLELKKAAAEKRYHQITATLLNELAEKEQAFIKEIYIVLHAIPTLIRTPFVYFVITHDNPDNKNGKADGFYYHALVTLLDLVKKHRLYPHKPEDLKIINDALTKLLEAPLSKKQRKGAAKTN